MIDLIETFTNNLLPILIISAIGFFIGRIFSIETRSVGRIVFYVLSPALVFDLLVNSDLPLSSIWRIMGITVCVFTSCGLLAWLIGRIFRFERKILTATILTSIMVNTGNYGLPVVAFAFGEEALAFASIYFMTNFMLTNTAGVLIASLGRSSIKEAFLGLLKVPAIYAIPLALIITTADWQIPVPVDRAIQLLRNAAIPAMLILLGMELQRAQWNKHIHAISISSIIRLVGGPILAIIFSAVFGISGAARQASVTEAGMPSAVLSTVIASEFDVEPSLVTAIVFISTLLSPLTLTPLLFFLR